MTNPISWNSWSFGFTGDSRGL